MKWGFVSLFLAISAFSAQAQTQISNIEDHSSGWGSCTSCAGGATNADVYWMAPFQTTPSKDGSSTQFHVSSGHSYSNVLFWRKLGAQDWATHFTWDFWVYLDQASLGAQALEYDMFQFLGGTQYMFGTECVYATGHWNVWNMSTGRWVPTWLTCNRFTPYVWHHIVWKFHRTPDKMMHYDSVALDGITHYLNITEPSGPLPSGWTDNLGVQWQLDTAAAPITFDEWVDKVSLTIQ